MDTNWTAIRQRLLGEQNCFQMPPDIEIPTLPEALMQFSQMADDPEATPRDLGQIIESDIGLTFESDLDRGPSALRGILLAEHPEVGQLGSRSEIDLVAENGISDVREMRCLTAWK